MAHYTPLKNLILIVKHDSFDVPPNVPYFTRAQKSVPQSHCTSTPNTPSVPCTPDTAPDLCTPVTAPISPGKCVSLRTECMEQLNKWHSLLEKHIISQDHYDKVQQAILKDLMD